MKRYITAALVATVLAVGWSWPAHANTVDDKFIATLDEIPVPYKSRADAITAGHDVCALMDKGRTVAIVADEIQDGSTLTEFQSGFFVGDAIVAYCPKYKNQLP